MDEQGEIHDSKFRWKRNLGRNLSGIENTGFVASRRGPYLLPLPVLLSRSDRLVVLLLLHSQYPSSTASKGVDMRPPPTPSECSSVSLRVVPWGVEELKEW